MSSPRSDEELIIAFKRGDIDAFEELLRRHQRPLINFFYRHGCDPHLSEDCAQEVFLRLLSHLEHYEPHAKFTTFLYRVARNLWIDRMRSKGAAPAQVSWDASHGDSPALRLGGESVAEDDPSDALVEGESIERLRISLRALPQEHREVILLAEYQGLKYDEIGEILGIPTGTVKSRMHHAIEKLKELLVRKS